MPQTDEPKPDEPHGMKPADGELARAYERIKSAEEDLARLDRVVSGLEHGSDSPPPPQESAGAERSSAAVNEGRASDNQAPPPSPKRNRPILRVLVGLLLAMGIVGAAFAARYGNEAKAIMARWAPQASTALPAASEPGGPAKSLTVKVAEAGGQPSAPPPSSNKEAPAPPSPQETKDAPPAGATTSPASTSADVAQSLKTISQGLASINEKLEQLKSSHDQTLREHADSIQQLKAAQEQGARDNARIAEQVQALQAQLAASSAKSSAPSAKKESSATARQRVPVAEPRRPSRSRVPWRPPPYMDEPWEYPDW
ncbi:hypothetical protein [Bradyrhizobium cenepequi]|uniref:hypothetical protein n=1 Tax=Bradyrhizobium cenepequi TaxID=2821403 RepID=UPI001CE358A0|nr:hypothetical protein [Bradyrhizobium cenepequi]